jgi:RNA polymerase sigma-70 factor (ECF subfamily)
MDSDRVLLNQAARGCKDSLRRIYETHKDHLLTIARSMTCNPNTAEDIVHDVFVALARGLPQLRVKTSLRGYLSVSVCNRVRDVARTEIRQRRDEGSAGRPPEDTTAPDAHAAETEMTGRLRAALEQVPSDQREVLLLRTQAGLSFKEIARHQGIPVNTAQGRYRYGIEKLRSLVNYFPRRIILMYGGRKHRGKREKICGGGMSEINRRWTVTRDQSPL